MRATLLTAQKMASQMVQDAEKEKAALLEKAEGEANARKAELEAEIVAETERLRIAREESAAFIANMRKLCSSELEFLDGVPEIQVEQPDRAAEKTVEEQVESIESSVMSTFQDKPAAQEDAAPAAEEDTEAPAAPEDAESVPAEGDDDDTVDLAATRRIDFGDLKFGRNYKRNS